MLHSEKPPERAVLERAFDALPDVPGLMRKQTEAPLFGMVREALGGKGETRGGERMVEKKIVRYLVDDQDLVWYELEQGGILTWRTSVLAVPGVWVADVLAFVHCQHAPRGRQDAYTTARPLPLAREVYKCEGVCLVVRVPA